MLIVLNSCQKEIVEEINQLSINESRFLNTSKVKAGDDEKKQVFVQKIINDIDRQNKEKRFIDNFVKKYGYPDWEMVRWFEKDEEIVAQIPVFYDDGSETEAVILCVEHKKKLNYRLFIRDDFGKYNNNKKPIPTAEKIKDLFIIFDFQKFGVSSYLMEGSIKSTTEISDSLKSANYYALIQTCYTIMVTSGNQLLSMRQECEYDYEWVSVSNGGGSYIYVDWYDESNGGSGTTSTPDECDCNICPVCGGCLNTPLLKSVPIPGGGGSGSTDIPCPMCSCTPTQVVLQQTLCDAYNGIVNMESLNNNIQNLSPYQEQFIISLANLAALHELGKSLYNLQTDLVNYPVGNSLYTKLNQLNNHAQYTTGWTTAFNSSTYNYDALVSQEIGNSGFQLKFYPVKDGAINALGLIKDNLPEHIVEAALEFLEYIDVKYSGFPDDYLYDMHLFNAINFMDYYCND